MKDYMLSLVEEIISKYKLEEDLFENDPLLKEKIGEADDSSDFPIIKILYSKKVKERLEKGIPLEEVIPSIRLKNILNQLINKEISYEELPKIIEEKLKVSELISKEISDIVKQNTEISKERDALIVEDIEIDSESKTSIEKQDTDNKKSIGYQLLK